MKRTKLECFISLKKLQYLIFIAFFCILLITLLLPFTFKPQDTQQDNIIPINNFIIPHTNQHPLLQKPTPVRPNSRNIRKVTKVTDFNLLSTLNYNTHNFNFTKEGLGTLHKSAMESFLIGRKYWEHLQLVNTREFQIPFKKISNNNNNNNTREVCPDFVMLTGTEFYKTGNVIVLPCGMTLGSYVTVVGRPRAGHLEREPKISLLKPGQNLMVSQFMMELQGLKTVDGEEPPRIFHFNPRLMGDWSGKPVIEMNTCYRMQWGLAHRCEGWRSRFDEENVDGQVKCEKWKRDDDNASEESKTTWWLNRMTSRAKKGFALEDATGLSLKGDVDVNSIFAGSLPSTHPSFDPQRTLEMSNKWKAPPLPDAPVDLFIGVLSAGNHFAERMAVRKSWMQYDLVRSSRAVARFFVALHARKEVNAELKKEADFFGDIVIVPYMDNYDLVVLKTIAICEYGVHTASAKYIMKCDDDTFVRVDMVLKEANKIDDGKSLYLGNINYYHKPLRYGKWAVSYEEWPEEDYPPYANGPGYIISSDIAEFIASEFEKHKLKLFKMEDVSMGMWVQQFNKTEGVEYVHSLKFCQFGCIEDSYTAHYQSPRQMLCMWNKLQLHGRIECCNMR